MIVSESIKFNAFNEANVLSSSDVDFTEVEKEVTYIVGLILAGITK